MWYKIMCIYVYVHTERERNAKINWERERKGERERQRESERKSEREREVHLLVPINCITHICRCRRGPGRGGGKPQMIVQSPDREYKDLTDYTRPREMFENTL